MYSAYYNAIRRELLIMKYAIVIMDGAADEPIEQFDGLTALEKADIPNTDWIAINGRQGLVATVPEGFPPGSDVAMMSLFGYDPAVYYTGRSPLEAIAAGIRTDPDDLIFRCNLVAIADGVMIDHSAGHIDSNQASELMRMLNDELGNDEITFYPGTSYRGLMVWKGLKYEDFIIPPHDILEQEVGKNMPRGRAGRKLCQLMEKAAGLLAEHDVNKVRCDLGENPASHIWLWGQGYKPRMESFRSRYGIGASVITAVDLVGGLARSVSIRKISVDGATGYIDTDYQAKGKAAIEAFADNDLVIVHVEAPDEASHGAMAEEKVRSIENIDKLIVGPILEFLKSSGDDWRIMVSPDHPTYVRLRTHVAEPVPFVMAGTNISPVRQLAYSEKNAKECGWLIARGHELMEYFLKAAI
ncbi:MAG: cofactor-independent phosphoglycerate mutase [Phycisphaerae bacterium]|nr:cofactor-independent phosphoglycerate mutase [Phycisphaerae bacterium]